MAGVKKYTVFFDFDNTISTYDVTDDLLERFSKDSKWIDLEKKWQRGKIGSKDCLSGQIKGIRITKKRMDEYLSRIRIDAHFKKIINLLSSKGIRVIILSDNFDYILRRILKNNGLRNLKIYSNRMEFVKDRLKPYFPFENKKCHTCAHCKKNTLLANAGKNSSVVYVGDGLSDACPAQQADVVFAKGVLLKYLKNKKFPCIRYRTLRDVYAFLLRNLIFP